MHDERLIPRQSVVSARICRWLVIRSFCHRKIWHVQSRPFFFLLVPPNQFLSFAPRRTVGAGRRAVIENPAIARPCPAPAVTKCVGGLPFPRAVFIRIREDARVNPAAASRRSVGLQFTVSGYLLAIGGGVAIDLLEHLGNHRFPNRSFGWIIPCERVETRITQPRIAGRFLLKPSA